MTQHCWETWAEYLGRGFASWRQLGIGGADNATIARQVVKHARPNDLVVILWSGHDRWSMYRDETFFLPGDPKNQWHHTGSLYNSKEFVVNFYHPVERFQTTMDYIQLLVSHIQMNGYTVYHFSAFPFFCSELGKNVDPRLVQIYYQYKIKNDFLLEKTLSDFQAELGSNISVIHKYNPRGDTHPTPKVQWEYLNKILAPKLAIDLSFVNESTVIEDQNRVLQGIVK